MVKMIVLIVTTVLGALLYRAGGMGKEDTERPKWIPKWMRNTKARDLGIPLASTALCLVLFGASWWNFLAFALTFGAQTSYFKKKGTDSQWYNWVFVGLAFSVAAAPIAIQTGHWHGFWLRTIIVTIFVPVWSLLLGTDWKEEMGRGAIQIITLALL